MTGRAVVLAYHDVGYRCLSVLLAHRMDIPLVVTHRDSPTEQIWFANVASLAGSHGLPVAYAEDLDDAALADAVRAAAPDFLFSFYFRRMLPPATLSLAPRGALNLHGSLLPHYRGRVPVNWAVIRGEGQTGASLHYMVAKPDAGNLVDQMAVPILPDDTAGDVFRKVTVAAEVVLDRSLPGLLAGTAASRPMDLVKGSYFGGRRPEDGRIDWTRPAADVHNLVRGVAPPYPGAFTVLAGRPARVLRTLSASRPTARPAGTIYAEGDRLFAACGDGRALPILSLEVDGNSLDAAAFRKLLGDEALASEPGRS
ncbi:MAG: formyltransferase [Betaproteobacteria bacterium]|nr:formyltransferase [Betaproteobacteria bacterium]